MKKLKKMGLFLFLVVFGVVFISVGIWLTKTSLAFKREGVLINAEIVRIDIDYDADGDEETTVYVKYTVDNNTYIQKLGYYSSALSVGDIVPIYYMPNKPTSITYGKAMFVAPFLFCFFGFITISLGVFLVGSSAINKGKLKRLKEYGQETVAVIKSFNYSENTYILGKHPAEIVCEDAYGNSYKAKFLYAFDMAVNLGDSISVYTDYKNDKKYIVDIEGYFKREGESSSKAYISDN